MLKFYMMDPEMAKEYISVFHTTLCDRDPTVMAATLNAYLVLIQVRVIVSISLQPGSVEKFSKGSISRGFEIFPKRCKGRL